MYQLVLDRKTILLALAGLCLAGALVFVAGMLVAVRIYLPAYVQARAEPEAGEDRSLSRSTQTEKQTQPQREPGREPDYDYAVRSERAGGRGAAIPSSLPLRQPRIPTRRAPSVGVPTSARLTPRLSPLPSDARAQPTAREQANTPAVEAPLDEAQTELYSVQVGAFVSEFNMENLLLELQDRGYQPYVVTVKLNRQILHTIRIGEYGSREEAVLAAKDFFRREGIAAVVRSVSTTLG